MVWRAFADPLAVTQLYESRECLTAATPKVVNRSTADRPFMRKTPLDTRYGPLRCLYWCIWSRQCYHQGWTKWPHPRHSAAAQTCAASAARGGNTATTRMYKLALNRESKAIQYARYIPYRAVRIIQLKYLFYRSHQTAPRREKGT